jgi:hypothetical protein
VLAAERVDFTNAYNSAGAILERHRRRFIFRTLPAEEAVAALLEVRPAATAICPEVIPTLASVV